MKVINQIEEGGSQAMHPDPDAFISTFTSLTCGTLSLLDDHGDPHDVEAELTALAPLAGASFTGNVSVAGILSQSGYNALTTQCITLAQCTSGQPNTSHQQLTF